MKTKVAEASRVAFQRVVSNEDKMGHIMFFMLEIRREILGSVVETVGYGPRN